jgi:hypothetical protein
MSDEAISGGKRRRQRQGAGSVEKVLNPLAFHDQAGPHISGEELPRTAESVEGLIHMLQGLDEFFRRRFVIFAFASHRHFPGFKGRAGIGYSLMQTALFQHSLTAQTGKWLSRRAGPLFARFQPVRRFRWKTWACLGFVA